jgi:tetratricopeptide (TPR) repeat protein
MSLACLGRMDEALQLDPLGFQVNQDAGLILLGSGQTEAAIGYLRHVLELAPGLRIARVYLTMAWLRLENFEEALDLAGDEPGLRALVRARMGETDAATDLVRAWQHEPPSFTWRAILELALGREESALTSFKRGAGQFESEFLQLFIGVPVLFEGLSGNSEFTGLIRT